MLLQFWPVEGTTISQCIFQNSNIPNVISLFQIKSTLRGQFIRYTFKILRNPTEQLSHKIWDKKVEDKGVQFWLTLYKMLWFNSKFHRDCSDDEFDCIIIKKGVFLWEEEYQKHI